MFAFDLQLFGGGGSGGSGAGGGKRGGRQSMANATRANNGSAPRVRNNVSSRNYSAKIGKLTSKDIKAGGVSFGNQSIRRAYEGKNSYYQVTSRGQTTSYRGPNALKRAKEALLRGQ